MKLFLIPYLLLCSRIKTLYLTRFCWNYFSLLRINIFASSTAPGNSSYISRNVFVIFHISLMQLHSFTVFKIPFFFLHYYYPLPCMIQLKHFLFQKVVIWVERWTFQYVYTSNFLFNTGHETIFCAFGCRFDLSFPPSGWASVGVILIVFIFVIFYWLEKDRTMLENELSFYSTHKSPRYNSSRISCQIS